MPERDATDEQLLLSGEAEDFGVFYDRHVDPLLGWFARRTRNPDVAADLTAETFAGALAARPRFRPRSEPAVAWLHGIAQHKLADYYRRGGSEDRMCRKLGMARPPLDDEDRAMIEMLAREAALSLVETLPADQRDAVYAHVLEDEGYDEIAASSQTSAATIRQRVSRGLAALRRREEARR
jgi:RNA polymerase sigma factor (sigma-70 family)